MSKQTEPMNPQTQFCQNLDCPARGQVGQGNIHAHSRKERRYRCWTCRHTFNEFTGTPLAGLRTAVNLVEIVMILLTHGCPLQAIVHAFGFDERTVANWRDRMGQHCERVHHATAMQAKLEVGHVQTDEIRVKGRKQIFWMGLSLMVSTRLWLGGVVSPQRNRALAEALMQQVAACARSMCAVLICTDGWTAYPNAIRRAFRRKVKQLRGAPRKVVWPQLAIGRMVKHTVAKRVVEVTRTIVHGSIALVVEQLFQSGDLLIHTAYIERLNATFRERLATLTRRCRHAAVRQATLHAGLYLIGCCYNFCWTHASLKLPNFDHPDQPRWIHRTPAMASGLTDHVWTMRELLMFKIAPSPYVPPKRRGRPPKVVATTLHAQVG